MLHHYSKTKIVATIGPASAKKTILKELIKRGMRVARLNFSHGDHKSHAKIIKLIRSISKELDYEIAILQDLQGPRIRLGHLAEPILLKKHQEVVLIPEQKKYKRFNGLTTIPVQYKQLYKDVKKDDLIFIADGTIRLQVLKVKGQHIHCKVVLAGKVSSNKGLNVPGVTLNVNVITEKDKKDIAFGQKHEVDFVALSFVKTASDMKRLKKYIDQYSSAKSKKYPTQTIAKIEHQQALDNFDQIAQESDGIMIARGDLGIEIDPELVPIYQKQMISHCLTLAKPVIVATQMLASMEENMQPTRAEVSDVANAIIDNTDATMLSGESANGKFPKESVQMMTNIAHVTEESHFNDYFCGPFSNEHIVHKEGFLSNEAIAQAICHIHADTFAKAVLVYSDSGHSARLISRHRPELPIIVLTKSSKVQRQLALSWGVIPVLVPKSLYDQKLINFGLKYIQANKIAKKSDSIILAGTFHKVTKKQSTEALKKVELISL